MRRRVETSRTIGTIALLLMAATSYAQITANTQPNVAQGTRQIVVSIPDRQLLLIENGRTLKTYPIAVGTTTSPSPAGEFKVINRLENPTYYKPGTVIGPGKGNPLGTRWIGLSQKGFGIHGTNAPGSIGKAASHGCIRMQQKNLEDLFALVRVGDVVSIREARDEQLAKLLAPEVSVETSSTQTQPVEEPSTGSDAVTDAQQ